jgi:serine protease Do
MLKGKTLSQPGSRGGCDVLVTYLDLSPMVDQPRRRQLSRYWLSLCSLTVLCGVSIPAFPTEGSELRQTPVVKAVQRVRLSVVNIRGEKTLSSSATAAAGHTDAGRRVNGMGTGIVIDPRGYILTNHHVVDGVREIQVTTANEERYTAKLVARDPETDLAIIKIDPRDPLPVIPVGTSSDLMPGESVIAVGNAYGYEHTVTRGIISALHRAVQVSDAQYYEDLIQTDASINPGNSGGPLLNIDGEMVGINVAVRAGAQGIGFAIPVNRAMDVAGVLLASANKKHVRHGVVLSTEAKDKGLVVASVENGSPAAEAGLQTGDVISAAGDMEIQRPLDFQRALLEAKAGQEMTLAVRRGEESLNLSVKLTQAPIARVATVAATGAGPMWDVLGVELKPIPQAEFRQQFQTGYRGGLLVTSVRPGSAAAGQGIRQGDVLVGMHIWETISLENVSYIINRPDFASLTPIKFFILRGSETLYGYLPVAVTKTAQR